MQLTWVLFCWICSVTGIKVSPDKYNVRPPDVFQVTTNSPGPHQRKRCFLEDEIYTHTSARDSYLYGGVGQLTDGIFGHSAIECSDTSNYKSSEWVGWKFLSHLDKEDRNLSIYFEFDHLYLFHSFTFNCLYQRFKSGSIYPFTSVSIQLLSADNRTELCCVASKEVAPNNFSQAYNLTVDAKSCHRPSRFVNMTFHVRKGKRIVLGEVQFDAEEDHQIDLSRTGVVKDTILSRLKRSDNSDYLSSLQTVSHSSHTIAVQHTDSVFQTQSAVTFAVAEPVPSSVVPSSIWNTTGKPTSPPHVVSTPFSSTFAISESSGSSEISQISSVTAAPTSTMISSLSPSQDSKSTSLLEPSHTDPVTVSLSSPMTAVSTPLSSQHSNSSPPQTVTHLASSTPSVRTVKSSPHNCSTHSIPMKTSSVATPSISPIPKSGDDEDDLLPVVVSCPIALVFILICVLVILAFKRRLSKTYEINGHQKGKRATDPDCDTTPNLTHHHKISGSFNGSVICNCQQRRPSDIMLSRQTLESRTEQGLSEMPVYEDMEDGPIQYSGCSVTTMMSLNQSTADSVISPSTTSPSIDSSRVAYVCDSVVFPPSFLNSNRMNWNSYTMAPSSAGFSPYDSGFGHCEGHYPDHLYECIEMDALVSGVTLRQSPRRVANLAIYASVDEINRHSMAIERQSFVIYDEVELNPDFILQGSIAKMSHSSESSSADLLPFLSVYADPAPLLQENGPLEMSSEKFIQLRHIGHGQFGDVYEGLARDVIVEDIVDGQVNGLSVKDMHVALKYLRKGARKDIEVAFNKEVKFMAPLKHPNVVQLIGVCSMVQPRFMVIEYMENGDLHQYLQHFEVDEKLLGEEKQLISYVTLLGMAADIACGMGYMASKFFIHRDLAARNCLVGQNHQVKISDFGMTRSVYKKNYYRLAGRAILPIRWMAPETFYGKFAISSDIWAFGVTCWEILTLARIRPYNDMQDRDVIENAVSGKDRKVLSRPDCCDDATFKIMTECWCNVPEQRPQFCDIHSRLRHLAAGHDR